MKMGKTHRKEKSFEKRRQRLNNHRDLPDFQDNEYGPWDEEDYFWEQLENEQQIRSKKQNVERPEDEPSGQAD
jgi:hypothetical protein